MEGILRISEAANLGLHAMVCLLGANPNKPLSVTDIATRLKVSRDHLGKVLQRLTRARMVVSRRGPKGGFALAAESRDLSLLQILEAIDGPLTSSTCLLGKPLCNGKCFLGDLMESLNGQVRDYFANTILSAVATISPLAERPVETVG